MEGVYHPKPVGCEVADPNVLLGLHIPLGLRIPVAGIGLAAVRIDNARFLVQQVSPGSPVQTLDQRGIRDLRGLDKPTPSHSSQVMSICEIRNFSLPIPNRRLAATDDTSGTNDLIINTPH